MTLFMTELRVRDVAAATVWYRDTLGLRVSHADGASGFVLFETPGGRLALKPGGPCGGITLHFRVEDLPRELARLATYGVVPDGPPVESAEGYREAFVRDPDGYRVGLFEFVREPDFRSPASTSEVHRAE